MLYNFAFRLDKPLEKWSRFRTIIDAHVDEFGVSTATYVNVPKFRGMICLCVLLTFRITMCGKTIDFRMETYRSEINIILYYNTSLIQQQMCVVHISMYYDNRRSVKRRRV